MKTSIFVALLLFTTNIYSQIIPLLKLTSNGVEPIVVNIDSISVQHCYKKTMDWINYTYKNPEIVLKAKIENEIIRIEGYRQNAWLYPSMGTNFHYDMNYVLQVDFKDGRYRLSFTPGDFYQNSDKKKVAYDYTFFFNKKGEPKKESFVETINSFENTMNSISLDLYNYITGNTKKEDW